MQRTYGKAPCTQEKCGKNGYHATSESECLHDKVHAYILSPLHLYLSNLPHGACSRKSFQVPSFLCRQDLAVKGEPQPPPSKRPRKIFWTKLGVMQPLSRSPRNTNSSWVGTKIAPQKMYPHHNQSQHKGEKLSAPRCGRIGSCAENICGFTC